MGYSLNMERAEYEQGMGWVMGHRSRVMGHGSRGRISGCVSVYGQHDVL